MRLGGGLVGIVGSPRLILVLSVVLLPLSACGNVTSSETPGAAGSAATPVASTSVATPEATAARMATAEATPSAGFTLTVTPDHGRGATRYEVSAPKDAMGGAPLTIRFLPAPSDKPVGTRSHPLYTGPIWPSSWQVHLNSGAHFSDIIKLPYVLQASDSGQLWLVKPGVHELVLLAGSRQVASTHFTVEAPPTPPNTTPKPEVSYHNLWPVDATTVWLTGERCQAAPMPTPDAYGNQGTPGPATCQGVLEVSHDAGKSWKAQPCPDPTLIPQTIDFTNASHGVMILTTRLFCGQGPCSSVIYLTHDGGQHWLAVYHTDPNTPDLIEHGRPVIAESVALTTLVFSNAEDGWAYGIGCSDLEGQDCHPVLLRTNDAGGGWSQASLPKLSCPCADIAHPTDKDGWILASSSPNRRPRLIATHDGGRTWNEVSDPQSQGFTFGQQIFFQSTSAGWLLSGTEPGAGQQAKTLYQTTDGGQSWTEIASAPFGRQSQGLPSSGYVGPIVFSTDHTGWIISGRLGLLRSTDGGKHWPSVPSIGYQDSLQDLRFSDPEHGWLLSNQQLWSTVDGGATWTTLSLPDVTSQ